MSLNSRFPAGSTPPDIHAAGRYRIVTDVPSAYALYGQVIRQNSADPETYGRAAMQEAGVFTLFMRQYIRAELSAEENSAMLQQVTNLLRRAQAVDPTHPLTNRLAAYQLLDNADTAGALKLFRQNVAVQPVYQFLADLCLVEGRQQLPPAPIPDPSDPLLADLRGTPGKITKGPSIGPFVPFVPSGSAV